MRKLTEAQAYARIEQFRARPTSQEKKRITMPERTRPADVSADELAEVIAENDAREKNRVRVASEFGDEVYMSLEASALNARDELVMVLERCGVEFTRETFHALGHVTIGMMNNATLAAIAVLDRGKT